MVFRRRSGDLGGSDCCRIGVRMSDNLNKLLKDAKQKVDKMTPKERQEMYEAQRKSWLRGEAGLRKSDKETYNE